MRQYYSFKIRFVLAIAVVMAMTLGSFALSAAQARRGVEAPIATITVDGGTSDWDGITGLSLTLEPIEGEEVEIHEATVKIAHDNEFVYALFIVDDDYNWNAENPHLSASPAILWAVDPAAGPHMGTDGVDIETSLGMVDIWHWELECGAGEENGGAVYGPGDGDPGDDATCNFDDEWATSPFEREDDNGEGAENSLLGVWTHTNPVEDGTGQYIFEMARPLNTADAQDAVVATGTTSLLAVAYWDPDNTPEGWDDAEHVQSSNQDWIEVTFAGGTGGGEPVTPVQLPSTGAGGTANVETQSLTIISGVVALLLITAGGTMLLWSRRRTRA